jgi:ATP-dependent 26S proteasome regulatory subunit
MEEFEDNQQEEGGDNIEINLGEELNDKGVIVIPINTTSDSGSNKSEDHKGKETIVKRIRDSKGFIKFMIAAVVIILGTIGIIYVARMPTKSQKGEKEGSEEGEFYTGYDIILDDGKNARKNDFISYVDRVIEETKIDPDQIKVSWDDVVGQDRAKNALIESIVWPLGNPEIFKGARAPPKGILLFGPPGTGKTMLAKAVAKDCNVTFFNVSASTFSSHYYGESERLMSALFFTAKKFQPSIIFIDEIDSILASRGGTNEHESSRKVKTEFMIRSEGFLSDDSRVVLIGATNRPQDLDEAVLRRFERKIMVNLPEEQARIKLLKSCISGVRNTITDEDFIFLSQNMEKSFFSSKDIISYCRYAALQPIRELKKADLKKIKEEDIRAVNKGDFVSAALTISSSISFKSFHELEEWDLEHGTDYVPRPESTEVQSVGNQDSHSPTVANSDSAPNKTHEAEK